MALAYPEGECFFDRAGLRSPIANGYRAENATHFHNHIMVEYLWNRPAHSGDPETNNPNGHRHPRSGYTITRRLLRKRHGGWNNLPISYGPSDNEWQITERHEHELCTNANTFDAWYYGASDEAWFMNMPFPRADRGERWIWIDMLAHIRAVYLPIAFTASENHPQLCGWVQINFARNRTVSVWRGGSNFQPHRLDSTAGLGVSNGLTIGIDVHGLIQLLSLPRQMRKDNPYALRMIKMVNRDMVRTVPVNTWYEKRFDIDWLRVANANFGLDLQWVPAQGNNWLSNFMMNVLTIGLGMIPVAGPFLAIIFPVAWTLITDPDSAYDLLKDLAPGIDLTDRIIREILRSFDETREYLPTGWEQLGLPYQPKSGAAASHLDVGTEDEKRHQMSEEEATKRLQEIGKSLAFAIAEEVLKTSKSGRNEEEEPDDGRGEDGVVERFNPPTVFPDEKGTPATWDD